jgi:hypothetical protein
MNRKILLSAAANAGMWGAITARAAAEAAVLAKARRERVRVIALAPFA